MDDEGDKTTETEERVVGGGVVSKPYLIPIVSYHGSSLSQEEPKRRSGTGTGTRE